mmetsp:Transcript_31707/g.86730  ORF Transcript_31707/g.86730 Transcript_31707/m.86730 type:complete len:278 (-) Transcript_31707:934-1767(-)
MQKASSEVGWPRRGPGAYAMCVACSMHSPALLLQFSHLPLHAKPNEFPPHCIAAERRASSSAFESYGGRQSWLKHVCADGRWSSGSARLISTEKGGRSPAKPAAGSRPEPQTNERSVARPSEPRPSSSSKSHPSIRARTASCAEAAPGVAASFVPSVLSSAVESAAASAAVLALAMSPPAVFAVAATSSVVGVAAAAAAVACRGRLPVKLHVVWRLQSATSIEGRPATMSSSSRARRASARRASVPVAAGSRSTCCGMRSWKPAARRASSSRQWPTR